MTGAGRIAIIAGCLRFIFLVTLLIHTRCAHGDIVSVLIITCIRQHALAYVTYVSLR